MTRTRMLNGAAGRKTHGGVFGVLGLPRVFGVFRVFAAAFLSLVTVLLIASTAVAQEFVKVDDGSREQLPATPFVAGAYGFIWVAVLLYVVMVARGLGRVRSEVDELRRRLDRGPSGLPPGA